MRREVEVSQDEAARLVDAMIEKAPWKDHLWARCALAIAARAIRRGRHLTDEELTLNLATNMDDGTPEGRRIAEQLRRLVHNA